MSSRENKEDYSSTSCRPTVLLLQPPILNTTCNEASLGHELDAGQVSLVKFENRVVESKHEAPPAPAPLA